MGKLHQFALFLRDHQARTFTSFHFTVPASEQVRERAQQFVSLFEQLTRLQIYGAVIDELPLTVDFSTPPPPTGTDTRLEINLYPDAPLAPRYGVVPIGFTIAGPNEEAAALTQQTQQQTAWQRLETELLPYICLVRGHHVSPQPNPIKRIELVNIDEEKRPQPGQPPVDAAIAVTEQKIASAQAQFAQLRRRGEEPTQKDFERLKKYQSHLAWLSSLKQLEASFFAQATARAPQLAVLAVPAVTSRPIKSEEKTMPEVNTDVPEKQESATLLPTEPEQADMWADVPRQHFFAPHYWLYGDSMRKAFELSERSYYRWIDTLKEHGLERFLPAQQQPRIKLFYRGDVERALRAATDAGAFRKPGRPAEPASQPVRSRAQAVPQTPGAPLAPATYTTGDRVDAEMVTKLHAIMLQQQAIVQQLATLTERLANQPNVTEVMGRAFDLLNNFGNFNQLTSQLLARLDKIESRLHTLPASLAHKHASSPKPKTATPLTKAKKKLPPNTKSKRRT